MGINKPRDYQRSKLYRWEDEHFCNKDPKPSERLSMKKMQQIVNRIWKQHAQSGYGPQPSTSCKRWSRAKKGLFQVESYHLHAPLEPHLRSAHS